MFNGIFFDKKDPNQILTITKILLKHTKGRLQLKILVVFTTKAWPLPPGKALVVQNLRKKITKLLSSWTDPGKNVKTKNNKKY